MKHLIYIAFFLLTGCFGRFDHGDWKGKICLDKEFNSDEVDLFYDATQEWHDKSNDIVDLTFSVGNDNNCDAVVTKALNNLPNGDFGYTSTPFFQDEETKIYISRNLVTTNEDVKYVYYHVILHELGHYLGAQHSPYCNDVMYWRVDIGVDHLSDRDIDQLWHPFHHNEYTGMTSCESD